MERVVSVLAPAAGAFCQIDYIASYVGTLRVNGTTG